MEGDVSNDMADETRQEETKTENSQASGAADSMKNDAKGMTDQLEATLDEYMIKKAPFQIPLGGKEFIAKVSPYLIIIGAVMFIPAVLALLGIGAVLSPFAMMGGYGMAGGYGMMGGWGISIFAGIISMVLELMALPGLFKRTKAAWRLVCYATIVSLIGSILSFNIVGGIIGAVIGWYILFQVKEIYKN